MPQSRQDFRRHIRQKRNQLCVSTQKQASLDLVQQFSAWIKHTHYQHIALYLANDGELDTTPLIHALWAQDKQIYLPVLHPFSPGNLLFLHYTPDSPMVTNKYGIAEPRLDIRRIRPAHQLDLIGTPLVGFDSQGQRLGMGGGYYDRTLANWFKTGVGPTPFGIAHDCQHVEQLPVEEWDIPLPTILTPSQIWQWEFPMNTV